MRERERERREETENDMREDERIMWRVSNVIVQILF